MKITKEELLKWLKDNADAHGADPERSHSLAENMLIDFIDDPEIRTAWADARDFWWYA